MRYMNFVPKRRRTKAVYLLLFSLLGIFVYNITPAVPASDAAAMLGELRAEMFRQRGPIVKHNFSSSHPPTILIWTSYFGKKWGAPDVIMTSNGSRCLVTHDKATLASADALIFHLFDLTPILVFSGKQKDSLPPYHRKDQTWILHNLEPNDHIYGDLWELNGHFNATWSFMRGSDIYSPYGRFASVRKASKDAKTNAYQSATKTRTNAGQSETKSSADLSANMRPSADRYETKAGTNADQSATGHDAFNVNYKDGGVAMISNCFDEMGRIPILDQMREFIPVRLLGACGEGCPGDYLSCNQETQNYKFFFALENSQCRDYVTEKYWRTIRNGQVPIVAWTYSMDGVVIPKSYININDFPSVKAAARYIQKVNGNRSLYNSYFDWRRDYVATGRDAWVDVCELLHSGTRTYITYTDMQGWLTTGTCPPVTMFRYLKNVLKRLLHIIGLS